jgi:mono/diheme cytochrome c family protein
VVLRIILTLLVLLTSSVASAQVERGYDPVMLETGKKLFQTNCAVCHGVEAEGTVENWQQRDADGKMPPPPLNGSAHTWHHPLSGLVHTIRNGTAEIGGNMPAWKDTLSDQQIVSVVAWLSSLWPDEIFNAWLQLNQQ